MRLVLVALSILFATSVQAADTCHAVFGARPNSTNFLELSSSRHLKNIAKKVPDFEAYAQREYPDADPLPRLKKLGEGYEQLIVDPGILRHLPEFEKFLSANDKLDPWVARDRFAREPYMQTKVYRGLALTKAELASVLKLGMRSNFARSVGAGTSRGSRDVYDRIGKYRLGDIDRRQQNSFDDSYLLSVTSYPEVAMAVSKHFENNPERSTVLFEIDISMADLITNDQANGIWKKKDDVVSTFAYSTKGEETVVPFDRRVESFVLWSIPAGKLRVIEGPRDSTFRFVD